MIASPSPILEPTCSSHRVDGPEIDVGTLAESAPVPADGIPAVAPRPADDRGQVDVREALYNGGSRGQAGEIQVPLERITSLGGFMLDLDPHLIRPDNAILAPSEDPATFLREIEPMLERHPLLRHAEVRASGNGLHLLVLIDPAVDLHTHGEQRDWDAMVKIVQRTLPAGTRLPPASRP